ncbi:uncharacterized protein DAT39_014411 [Clarias magur]|uniref:Uncharacterized protein n=1 Tax=Clarias magur TaxID=1594786 RepID=A0A8J4TU98_CLAMG|nr:uncharacterized protein DAT39_014411 [Clarias magur]
MVELAFYPTVALIYFFGVLQATKTGRVELPDSASVNVFCLFVLIQPLCLVIGGYTEKESSVSIQRFILPCQQPNEPWPQQFSCS